MGATDVRLQNINQGDRKDHVETAVGDFVKNGGMQMSAEASERNLVGRQRMLLKYHKAEPKVPLGILKAGWNMLKGAGGSYHIMGHVKNEEKLGAEPTL